MSRWSASFASFGSVRNGLIRNVGSNLFFTATFSKRKPLIFLEKIEDLCFLASEKRPYGTEMGLARHFGAQIEAVEWITDLRQLYDELGYSEPNSKDDFHAI